MKYKVFVWFDYVQRYLPVSGMFSRNEVDELRLNCDNLISIPLSGVHGWGYC